MMDFQEVSVKNGGFYRLQCSNQKLLILDEVDTGVDVDALRQFRIS